MSRGFVKEGDQEEPIFIPPRAALPEHEANYVTPKGLNLLEEERRKLEEERVNLTADNDAELRRETAILDGKMRLLVERINSARVIEPGEQPKDEVRFGARVTFLQDGKKPQKVFQIVGVDEADVKNRKVAFVAPIARALTGARQGEVVDFLLGGEIRKLEILDIRYGAGDTARQ